MSLCPLPHQTLGSSVNYDDPKVVVVDNDNYAKEMFGDEDDDSSNSDENKKSSCNCSLCRVRVCIISNDRLTIYNLKHFGLGY